MTMTSTETNLDTLQDIEAAKEQLWHLMDRLDALTSRTADRSVRLAKLGEWEVKVVDAYNTLYELRTELDTQNFFSDFVFSSCIDDAFYAIATALNHLKRDIAKIKAKEE